MPMISTLQIRSSIKLFAHSMKRLAMLSMAIWSMCLVMTRIRFFEDGNVPNTNLEVFGTDGTRLIRHSLLGRKYIIDLENLMIV